MKNATLIFFMLISSSLLAQENGYNLTVKIENVKTGDGKIKVGLFNEHVEFLKTALQGADIVVSGDELLYTFKGLQSGVYAVSIFHDKNDNGKLDSNFMGIPKEPYAFSNNAKGLFGPPSFSECKFEINDDHKEITIAL